MKKQIIFLLITLLILPSIFAVNLEIEKLSTDEVLIIGLDKPVVFDLKITNLDVSGTFEFYNLAGFETFPKGTVPIAKGETENVELKFSPIGEFKLRGFYTLKYYVRGFGTEISKDLVFNVIDLKDAFKITSTRINPESESVEIEISNKVNYNFENIKAKFSSQFFEFEEEFSLNANGNRIFNTELNSEDFNKLTAGFYTLETEMEIDGKEAVVESTIEFSEQNKIVTSEKNYGFIIYTKVIEKSNQGNLLEKTETTMQKNILSRLFTSFSPEPDIVERDGNTITYTWNQNIKPGETLKITIRTNWLFPLVLIFLVVVVVILVKQYVKTDLEIRKKVSFVHTKGGEFALKISIILRAKKYIERINVIDRLPPLTKVYHKFGGEKPSKIDEKNRRLEWNIEKLEAGETRVFSYVIYSKIGILGRFALPTATAIFEREGQIKDAESNRAFFVTEQRGQEIDGE